MAWVKLDDTMPTHPKVLAAGPQAFALDVAGICYSNKHATDGMIASYALPAVLPGLSNPKRHAAKLVEVGRWVEVDGGWVIHDVQEYQPTAAEQKEVSRKRAEAGRKGGSKSKRPGEATSKQSAKQVASVPDNPDPTRPVPKNKPLASDKPTRPPDPIFESIIEACGLNLDELTKSARGATNRAAKELREVGATPDGIRARAKVHRKRWPDAECTPSSLAKNYAQLNAKSVPDGPRREPEFGSVEWEARERERRELAESLTGGAG